MGFFTDSANSPRVLYIDIAAGRAVTGKSANAEGKRRLALLTIKVAGTADV